MVSFFSCEYFYSFRIRIVDLFARLFSDPNSDLQKECQVFYVICYKKIFLINKTLDTSTFFKIIVHKRIKNCACQDKNAIV